LRGLLKGERWLMPGLILSMPDPMGGKRKKILLASKRARKYGASIPRKGLVAGGIRL